MLRMQTPNLIYILVISGPQFKLETSLKSFTVAEQELTFRWLKGMAGSRTQTAEGLWKDVAQEVAVWSEQEFPHVDRRVGTKGEPPDGDSEVGWGREL